MKFTYQTSDNSWTEKESDWSVEECEKNSGHCWVEFQSQAGCGNSNGFWFPPKERTCKHCGKKQALKVIPQEQLWEDKP